MPDSELVRELRTQAKMYNHAADVLKEENMKGMELLGLKARDIVTGFEGTVSTISYDLFGCVQAVISPDTDKDGKMKDGHWFDVKRLKVLSQKPVMPVPTFELIPGPASKPGLSVDPARK